MIRIYRSPRRSKLTLPLGLRDSKKWINVFYMASYIATSQSLLDIVYIPSKSGGFDESLGMWQSIKLSLSPRNFYIAMGRNRTWKYVVVPRHGPLSLYTELEGPSIAKLEFLLPTIHFSDDFQRPLAFNGHGSWYVCKMTFSVNKIW